MIVPKATVRVVDRLDPALVPAVVADVPIGLALFASVTSKVGDGLNPTADLDNGDIYVAISNSWYDAGGDLGDAASATFTVAAAEPGPISPFWAVVPMVPAADGLSVAGLRLTDGSLVLKLERAGTAAQFRLEPGGGFDPGNGMLAQHDLLEEPGVFVAGLRAAWALAVGEGPRRGGGRAPVTC